MRKITLVLMFMLTFAGLSIAQTIEDFESIKMNIFSQGANGSVSVIPNPDASGIDSSINVGKMVRGHDGDPWAGWYSDLAVPVNPSVTRYVHLKIWKPRVTPVDFKFEGTGPGSGDVYPMQPQALVNQWEELVFDMGTDNVDYPRITLIPDFEQPSVTLTEDITIYFDDIYLNNDSTIGSAPVRVIEDYETIPLNLMNSGNADDMSLMSIYPNPDKSGINQSDNVIDFLRDKDGIPWEGFWSGLPTPVDVTTNKYVHVMVWKPRISTVKFKLEGGAAGTLEIPSSNTQMLTNVWEEMVFDFSSLTGTYPTIVFMPDYNDPVDLSDDIHIYFDNIVVNNNPNVDTTVTFKVNMSYWESLGKFNPATDFVDVAGSFNDWGGTSTVLKAGADGIYYGTVSHLAAGSDIAFKFRINGSWDDATAEFPAGGPNRTYAVEPGTNLYEAWYNDEVAGIVNPLIGKVKMYPNPVANQLIISATSGVQSVTITSMLGQVVGTYAINTGSNTISTSDLSSGIYFVTFTGNDGSQLTQKLVKE